MAHSTIFCGFYLVNLLLLSCPVIAGDNPRLPPSPTSSTGVNQDLALSITRFGTNFVFGSAELISQSGKSGLSATEAAMLGDDLVALTGNYRDSVREATFAGSLVQTTGDVIITSTQVLATMSGIGAVPAAAVAQVARVGNEKIANYVANEGRQAALGVLSSGIQHMTSRDRSQFDKLLKNNKPIEAAKFFESRTGKLTGSVALAYWGRNYS